MVALNPPVKKNKHIVILKRTFIAEVVKWGIMQNPFAGQLPRKTETIVERLNTLLPEFIDTTNIRAFTGEIVEMVPEIREWNLSQVEYERGVKVDDESRPPFAFASRYDQPKPEHDFIDLDALKQNIVRSIEQEQ